MVNEMLTSCLVIFISHKGVYYMYPGFFSGYSLLSDPVAYVRTASVLLTFSTATYLP